MTKNLSLVDLVAQADRLLLQADGEITDEIDDALFEEASKVDAYAVLIERAELFGTYYNDKAKDISAVGKKYTTIAKNMKGRIKDAMLLREAKELDGHLHRYVLSHTKPSIVITNEDELPAALVREKVVHEPDKVAIAERVKNLGEFEAIPGVKVVESYSLRKYTAKPQLTEGDKNGK